MPPVEIPGPDTGWINDYRYIARTEGLGGVLSTLYWDIVWEMWHLACILQPSYRAERRALAQRDPEELLAEWEEAELRLTPAEVIQLEEALDKAAQSRLDEGYRHESAALEEGQTWPDAGFGGQDITYE